MTKSQNWIADKMFRDIWRAKMLGHFGWPWGILTVFIFVIMPSATNELCPLAAIRSNVSFTWILVALDDHGSDIWVHNSPPPWLMWRAGGVGWSALSSHPSLIHWPEQALVECTVHCGSGGMVVTTRRSAWTDLIFVKKFRSRSFRVKKILKKARNSRHTLICNRSA